MANAIHASAIVLRVLHDWADARVHEANVLAKVAGINPQRAESGGKVSA